MVRLTGLEPEITKKIGALSKGYKQRVGLAQAIIHDPEVLILDEPTSGLDPNQIVEIRNLIKSLGKEKTVILSTHIMQEVKAICDRILVIRKGELVADGDTQDFASGGDDIASLLIEFGGNIAESEIRKIHGVRKVVMTSQNHYTVDYDASADIRESIFKLAVANGVSVLSMQKAEKSLEDVFSDLTTK